MSHDVSPTACYKNIFYEMIFVLIQQVEKKKSNNIYYSRFKTITVHVAIEISAPLLWIVMSGKTNPSLTNPVAKHKKNKHVTNLSKNIYYPSGTDIR